MLSIFISVYKVTYNIHHSLDQVTYNICRGVYNVKYIYQCV